MDAGTRPARAGISRVISDPGDRAMRTDISIYFPAPREFKMPWCAVTSRFRLSYEIEIDL